MAHRAGCQRPPSMVGAVTLPGRFHRVRVVGYSGPSPETAGALQWTSASTEPVRFLHAAGATALDVRQVASGLRVHGP